MRASQTQRAQPLPLPLPPPPLCLPSPHAVPRRGRHRSSYSSSSSSSSVSSAASTFCPSPSPAASPLGRSSTSASSLVPFSWERHPGVPKNSFRSGLASPTGTPLPLPPPLRPAPRRRRRRPRAKAPAAHASAASGDPFVAAFAECTRDDDGEDDEADHGADTVTTTAGKDDKLCLAPAKPTVSGRAARPWRPAAGQFLGFLDLYGCKSAMAVADGVFLARRPVVAARPGPASGRGRTRRDK